MKKIEVSIIIPVRTITPYLRETIDFLKGQVFKNFEVIIITDKKENFKGARVFDSGEPTPAYKRNLGAKKSRGKILAFLDDDSYPGNEWLENALKIFKESSQIAAVCGPALTPLKDNIFQRASGWVWASWLGSGGAGVYRNRISSRREVEDFPSVNLLIRKTDFNLVGGFDVKHWPGEDTKLCLDLVKQGKRIVYDPGVLVYHHRRPVFLPHLKQISRYAMRRGHFAKIFPETSLKAGYLLPSLFTYGLIFGLIVSLFVPRLLPIYFLFFSSYFLLLFFFSIEVLIKERNLILFLLVVPSVYLTHFTYGLLFPIGYFQETLQTVPHEIDGIKKAYIGG